MLYISSACVKHSTIKDSVEELALNGFKNIELSGGTKHYAGFEDDLLRLQEQYGLNYLVHNYFPPPTEDFILNLASLNDDVYRKSFEHCQKAIALSRKLGATKFGVHAGFFFDFSVNEIGRNISLTKLYDIDKATEQFCDGFNALKETAKGVELYIENNVLSQSNAKTFVGQTPLMLMDYEGYVHLKARLDFHLLLDVAHLYVTANSLGFSFTEHLNQMLAVSDYVHISENDGLHDQSRCFTKDSRILNILKSHDLSGKTLTAETYGALDDIKSSQSVVKLALHLD